MKAIAKTLPLIIIMLCTRPAVTIQAASVANTDTEEWFCKAKLGLFLHWGLYSVTAGDWNGHPAKGGEHFMLYERIPLKTYATIASRFNAGCFNARQWARTARRAGMKYVVITAKHHDGFAMYGSKASHYNIVEQTPFGRDPIRELAEACHSEGLRFGIYYSLGRDWEDPDVPTNWPVKGGRSNTWDYPDEDAKQLPRYLERKVKPQLRELLTNYGNIDILWFDTPELITAAQSRELRRLVRSLQPRCIINNRIGNGQGDYRVVEQELTNNIDTRPWEACLTMGRNWCYNRYDTTYKQPDVQLRLFTDIVSKGGNLLLNIGPDGEGRFPALSQPALKAFGQWLRTNGEAIYETRPWHTYGETLRGYKAEQVQKQDFHDAVYDGTPHGTEPDVRYTCRDSSVYIIVRHVPLRTFTLTAFGPDYTVRNLKLLDGGRSVPFLKGPAGLTLRLPDGWTPQSPLYVIKASLAPTSHSKDRTQTHLYHKKT